MFAQTYPNLAQGKSKEKLMLDTLEWIRTLDRSSRTSQIHVQYVWNSRVAAQVDNTTMDGQTACPGIRQLLTYF